jgi:hypothetical protein
MIWVTWRQFRAQLLGTAAVLIVIGVALGLTGPGLADLYASSGLASCHAPRDCTAMTTTFLAEMKADSVYPLMYFAGFGALLLTPPMIGMFWGAPLFTREMEGHTLRLAWAQSVTRTRWTVVKVVILGLAAMAVAGLLSLMVTWWSAPIDSAGGFPAGRSQLSRFHPPIFDARGIAPLGHAAFGFAAGVLIGVLVRRTVSAMAATLVVIAAVQFLVPTMVRPNLISPERLTSPTLTSTALDQMDVQQNGQLTVPFTIPGAWIVSNQTVTASGQVFTLPEVPPCQTGTHEQCVNWVADQNLRQVVTYQPASRYWEFQWYETVLFLAGALVLSGACVLWIRSSVLG